MRPRNSAQRKNEEPTSLPVPTSAERPPGKDIAIGFCLVAVFFILSWSALSNFWHDRTAPELQRGLEALANKQVMEAKHYFDSVLNETPDDPVLYLKILNECEKYHLWDLLVQYGERSIEDCRYAPRPVRAFLYAKLTVGYLGLDKKDEALLKAKRAWELDRSNPDMMNHYGYMLADCVLKPEDLNTGEFLITQALQIVREQARTAEEQWSLFSEKKIQAQWTLAMVEDSYGWVCYRRGRYQEAVTVLTTALNRVPEELVIGDALKEVYYHLGAAYRKIGRCAEAQQMLEVALYYDASFRNARMELEALLNSPPLPLAFLPGPQFNLLPAFSP